MKTKKELTASEPAPPPSEPTYTRAEWEQIHKQEQAGKIAADKALSERIATAEKLIEAVLVAHGLRLNIAQPDIQLVPIRT